jgi:hypothetical protein
MSQFLGRILLVAGAVGLLGACGGAEKTQFSGPPMCGAVKAGDTAPPDVPDFSDMAAGPGGAPTPPRGLADLNCTRQLAAGGVRVVAGVESFHCPDGSVAFEVDRRDVDGLDAALRQVFHGTAGKTVEAGELPEATKDACKERPKGAVTTP